MTVPRMGAVLLATAIAVMGTACGSDPDATLTVVVTTTPLGDVVGNVVGDHATVEVLIPVGADAHSFQPSARQVAAIQEAGLVVANGLDLEEGLSDVLRTAEADGANVLEVAPLVDPLPMGDGLDPHVWLDPMRMAEAARLIAAELAAVDSSVDWSARAESYAADLAAADSTVATILSAVPAADRKLVTNHDSFRYFAARYGFEVVGVVIPGGSTVAEPSSAELAALVEIIVDQGVPAIFTETSQPGDLARAIAEEADVAVVELYTESLGEEGSGAETLIGMLTTNADRVADALS